jgi:hypothetical protein
MEPLMATMSTPMVVLVRAIHLYPRATPATCLSNLTTLKSSLTLGSTGGNRGLFPLANYLWRRTLTELDRPEPDGNDGPGDFRARPLVAFPSKGTDQEAKGMLSSDGCSVASTR